MQRDWRFFLGLAREVSNAEIQELLYTRSLREAEKTCGCNSLQLGIVLLEWSEWCGVNNRDNEARNAHSRAITILRRYVEDKPDLLSRKFDLGSYGSIGALLN